MADEAKDTTVVLEGLPRKKGFVHYRYVVSLMAALGTMNVYSLRNGINVAMVTMCDPTLNGSIDWTKTEQGLVMGAYYWGYVPTNLPGAWFAKTFGIRNVFGITSLLASVLTLFMPVAAKSSVTAAMALRVILGLFAGVAFPVVYTSCGMWAPATERSRHLSIGFSGTSTGNFVVFPIIGFIIAAMGWEAVFYFTGAFGIIWSVIWWLTVRDNPDDHPWVTEYEKKFIGSGEQNKNDDEAEETSKAHVPWLSIVTSIPFWALVIPHIGENYLSSTTVSWFPTYMKNFLGFDIKSAAFLASLPFLMKFFVQLGSAFFADVIIDKGWLGKTITVRKVFTSVGFLFPCVAYIIIGIYADIPVPFAITLLVIGESFLSFCYPGYRTVFVDITPVYSGIIYSISNTLASVLAAIAPIVTGKILESGQKESVEVAGSNVTTSSDSLSDIKNNATQEAWAIVFYVSSVIAIIGLIVFLVFGTTETQPWNSPADAKKAAGDDDEATEEDKML